MHPDVEARLLQVNREFYQRFAESFAETRSRPRPGTMDLLSPLTEGASVLDLGCGNGSLAQSLAERGHRGRYIGVDNSKLLLGAAHSTIEHPRATFLQADLADPGWRQDLAGPFDWVCLLAILHHIPGHERRARLVKEAADLLESKGRALVSVWNFKAEPDQAERIVPWSAVGLDRGQVDQDDYLLDWRRGGQGLRYVHHFTADELEGLARGADFTVERTAFAGGDSGQLNLLQRWRP